MKKSILAISLLVLFGAGNIECTRNRAKCKQSKKRLKNFRENKKSAM